MSETPEEVSESPVAGQSDLGAMLREARTLRDLSMDDLARRLRLEQRVVRLLENNQFDQLGAPAFIRGYLRSIARELEIDSGPLIAVFDLKSAGEPPPLVDFETRPRPQVTSETTVVRYTSIALALGMVALIVLWWRSHDTAPANDVQAPVALPESAELAPSDALPGFDEVPPAGLATDVAGTVLDDAASAFIAPDSALDNGSIAGAEPGLLTDDAADESAMPAQAAPGDSPAATPDDDGVRSTSSSSVRSIRSRTFLRAAAISLCSCARPDDGAATLGISTSADAWIEVRDGNDERLLFGLVRPDAPRTLRGALPYTLVIGNTPAVSVQFNGAAVDLAPHSNEGVARLVLGDTAENPGEAQP